MHHVLDRHVLILNDETALTAALARDRGDLARATTRQHAVVHVAEHNNVGLDVICEARLCSALVRLL